MRPSSWIPPVAWMAVIMVLSSASFSSQHTGTVLTALLAWVAPWIAPAEVATLHGALRKVAHVAEYAILALLWFRALDPRHGALPRRGRGRRLRRLRAVGGARRDASGFVPDARAACRTSPSTRREVVAALAIARRDWLDTGRALTSLLLWLAAIGGAVCLAIIRPPGCPRVPCG